MRHKEFTTDEIERRYEEMVADRIYAVLNNARISRHAVANGIKRGQGRYIAMLMPGKRETLRQFRAEQAQKAAKAKAEATGLDVDAADQQ
jgi:hypothetical protein